MAEKSAFLAYLDVAINLSKFDSREHLNNVSKIVLFNVSKIENKHVDSEEILEQLLSLVGRCRGGQFLTT
jgi:hypothetical protein